MDSLIRFVHGMNCYELLLMGKHVPQGKYAELFTTVGSNNEMDKKPAAIRARDVDLNTSNTSTKRMQ